MPHPSINNSSFFFIGDLAISGDIQLEDIPTFSRSMRQLISKGDWLFANLEIPITASPYTPVHTSTEEIVAAALTDLGVTHVNLANNHILDSGRAGLAATIAMLDRLNIGHTGAGLTPEHCQPMLLEWNGKRVAFFGFVDADTNIKNLNTPDVYVNVWNDAVVKDQIQNWIEKGYEAWVSLHWGVDYSHLIDVEQQRKARCLIQWGAKLVAGHHAHVMQPMSQHSDSSIFFGLGGYVFGNFNKRGQWNSLFKKTKVGLIVKAQIDDRSNFKFSFFKSREKWNHEVEISAWEYISWSRRMWILSNIKNSSSFLKNLFTIFENQCCKMSHHLSIYGSGAISKWMRIIFGANRR